MPLRVHIGAKPLIESLRDSRVDAIVIDAASDIDTVALVLGVDPTYLSVQVRLLVPFFTTEQIHNANPIPFIRNILRRLRESLAGFEQYYAAHRRENRIDSLPLDAKIVSSAGSVHIRGSDACVPLRFIEVDAAVGIEIQEQLHYIHKARHDTLFHFGYALEGTSYPLCYCSLSRCDREYQARALSEAMGRQVSKEQILVMTRAFGFTPLPHNMMGKLFDEVAASVCRRDLGIQYIITALNPFLGFRGSIFLGSSYMPVATSPMVYNYSEAGLYRNRRSAIGPSVRQRYGTPPIIWLARSLRSRRAQRTLEALQQYYEINEAEYAEG